MCFVGSFQDSTQGSPPPWRDTLVWFPPPTDPGLICVMNKRRQKWLLRLGFQRLLIPCWFPSLILITCSRGMLYHEEPCVEGTMPTGRQPGEWAWSACFSLCQSFRGSSAYRQRAHSLLRHSEPDPPGQLSCCSQALRLGSLETEWDNPHLLFLDDIPDPGMTVKWGKKKAQKGDQIK